MPTKRSTIKKKADPADGRIILGVWPKESTAQKHARAQAKAFPASEPEVVPQDGGFAIYIKPH